MKKRIMTLLLSTLLLGSTLVSCAQEIEVEEVPEADVEVEVEEEPEPEPEPEVEYIEVENPSPLSGLEMDESLVGNRPLSIIINNAEAAWPQEGLSAAEIIYEWPYEGTSTRLMIVMMDYMASETYGPVRSVRHDFVELSLPHDTLFVSWGGSTPGEQWIDTYDVDWINGMTDSCFFRDQDRLDAGIALEHTGMLDSSLIDATIASKGYETTGDIEDAFLFNYEVDGVSFEDTDATSVGIDLSDSVYCIINYDEEDETYYKIEYGQEQIDENTGERVTATNVFLLEADISTYQTGYVWRDLELENGGTGYYMTMGTKIEITWSKDSATDALVYMTLDGEEVEVNPGVTFVTFCETGREITWSPDEA